jgi:Tfp pilus assembly PilM family ATPase
MLRVLARKPRLGIEITASAVRVAVVSGYGANLSVLSTKTVDVPDGVVNEIYASPNVSDMSRLSSLLRECLDGVPAGIRRAGLSLSDSVFRVQTIDFEKLPDKTEDRQRLIRWRLEKGAAFDIADTVLRYQILGRQDKGFTVLSCVAKQAVIARYESLFFDLGLEPWAVGPSSFYAFNLYSSYLAKKSAYSALTYLSRDSFATIIGEPGGVRFYRYKDVKRGSAENIREKIMREIEDSLHFFRHMDRLQQSEVRDLYLAGESGMSADLAGAFRAVSPLTVEELSPEVAALSGETIAPEMTAALGAGSSV